LTKKTDKRENYFLSGHVERPDLSAKRGEEEIDRFRSIAAEERGGDPLMDIGAGKKAQGRSGSLKKSKVENRLLLRLDRREPLKEFIGGSDILKTEGEA